MSKGHRSQIKKERNKAKDLRPTAHARYVRISDRKARIVLEQVKGKDVGIAISTLMYSPRYASDVILKVLKSAIANAENNLGMDISKLFVQEVLANQGPTLKRFRPRSHGRAYKIMKRTCHITIILNER